MPYRNKADHNASVRRGYLKHAGEPCFKCGRHPRPAHGNLCKLCKANYEADLYQAKPDRWRRAALRRKFGITLGEYNSLLNQQSGSCAICNYIPQPTNDDGRKSPKRRLAVDHDHKTGLIRGLLCHMCNRGLPMFRDRAENLERAAAYLRSAF